MDKITFVNGTAPALSATNLNLLQTNVESAIANIIDTIYPVGSIFTSTNSTNPSTFLGGSWEEFGNGRVIVGVDNNKEEYDLPNITGGNDNYTYDISHKHPVGESLTNTDVISGDGIVSLSDNTGDMNSNSTLTINSVQSYITAYRFRRIS